MAWHTKFYSINEIDDALLHYVVIVSKFEDSWVYCKHKDRNTWELPGGHREPSETVLAAAHRELYEETGAKRYTLTPIDVFSIIRDEDISQTESFGLLYYADIKEFEPTLRYEIKNIEFFYTVPSKLTYPESHLDLFLRVNMAI